MKTCVDLPDAAHYQEKTDKEYFDKVTKKIERMKGRLVSWSENKDLLSSFRENVYCLPRSTVRVMENTNSSLNQYTVSVDVRVYASSTQSAMKTLEKIVG